MRLLPQAREKARDLTFIHAGSASIAERRGGRQLFLCGLLIALDSCMVDPRSDFQEEYGRPLQATRR
jgi:hypothetical protein